MNSFLGVTPEKAKIIALEENKKLKNELEAAMKELKISLEESTAETQREFAAQKEKEATEKASTPSQAAPAPTLLVNAMNSSANFELDDALKSKIDQLAKELKDNQLTNIENEEQIQMMNKRISAMEGGNAGVLGLIERINEVNIEMDPTHVGTILKHSLRIERFPLRSSSAQNLAQLVLIIACKRALQNFPNVHDLCKFSHAYNSKDFFNIIYFIG